MITARLARTIGAALLAGTVLAACTVPIVADVDEAKANHVVAALDASGIVGEKFAQASGPNQYRVEVPRDDVAQAVRILLDEGVAARTGATRDTGALVPSREAEHARLMDNVATALERSLEATDGVIAAHVHLAAPAADALAPDDVVPRPHASVLIRYRGSRPPLVDMDVKRLVAFAVAGLSADDVAVVNTRATGFTPRDVAYVGPLAGTRENAKHVRMGVGVVAILDLALVALLLTFWQRWRKLRPRPSGPS